MARPAGVKNQDYADKRAALLNALADFVLSEDVFLPSLRQLAIAAGTSEPTLKHYFKDRTGVVMAILEHFQEVTDPLRESMRQPLPSLEEAMVDYARLAEHMSADGRYINAHVFAIRESMVEPKIFEAYVRCIIEPGTAALAERLVKSKGGPRNFGTARVAANMIITNASVLAFRHSLLGAKDPASNDFKNQFGMMKNWMLYGMVSDPEGTGT